MVFTHYNLIVHGDSEKLKFTYLREKRMKELVRFYTVWGYTIEVEKWVDHILEWSHMIIN